MNMPRIPQPAPAQNRPFGQTIRIVLYRVSLVMLAFFGMLPMSGCGPSSKPSPAAKGPATPLETAIKSWSAGSQDEAVAAFLKIDWTKDKAFATGSALGKSESDFAALPAQEREAASKEMLKDLQSLKLLCSRVMDKGRELKGKADNAAAELHFRQVQKCGESVDNPSSPVIAQLVGKALKKLASRELGGR